MDRAVLSAWWAHCAYDAQGRSASSSEVGTDARSAGIVVRTEYSRPRAACVSQCPLRKKQDESRAAPMAASLCRTRTGKRSRPRTARRASRLLARAARRVLVASRRSPRPSPATWVCLLAATPSRQRVAIPITARSHPPIDGRGRPPGRQRRQGLGREVAVSSLALHLSSPGVPGALAVSLLGRATRVRADGDGAWVRAAVGASASET